MTSTNALALDLHELNVEPIVEVSGLAPALESLDLGHGMTELAASCIGSPLLVCSCCCCCAG